MSGELGPHSAQGSQVGRLVLRQLAGFVLGALLLVGFVYFRYQINVERYDLNGNNTPELEAWQQDFIDQGCYMVDEMVVCS